MTDILCRFSLSHIDLETYQRPPITTSGHNLLVSGCGLLLGEMVTQRRSFVLKVKVALRVGHNLTGLYFTFSSFSTAWCVFASQVGEYCTFLVQRSGNEQGDCQELFCAAPSLLPISPDINYFKLNWKNVFFIIQFWQYL